MKRTNRNGSLGRRANGSWEARYTDAAGLRHSISRPTKQAAEEALQDRLKGARDGLPSQDQRGTVDQWLDDWLASNVRGRLRPSTMTSYEETARRYIRPALGRIQLAKLSQTDITRSLIAPLLATDLSPTTVRYAYSVLRIALGRAVKAGRVVRNVATLVDPPAKAMHQIRPLSVAEVGKLRTALVGHRYEALILTAIGTGLRQGELLALRWSDVDLEAGVLTVRHTLERKSRRLAEPKTERSRRVLRLPLPVTVALRRLPRTSVYVFPSQAGGPLDSRHVTQALQLVLARAGMRPQSFHQLRHAFATLQLEAGAELFEVSRALGHSDIGTTANVYAHFTEAMAERTADRMAGILQEAAR